MRRKMDNEHNKKELTRTDEYKFIEYRLDQLEQNLRKGQEKLEADAKHNNEEIMQLLQQNNQTLLEQNKQLVELQQRQINVEEKVSCINRLREVATKNRTNIHEIERRLEVYKQILFVVGTGVAIALIKAFVFQIG